MIAMRLGDRREFSGRGGVLTMREDCHEGNLLKREAFGDFRIVE